MTFATLSLQEIIEQNSKSRSFDHINYVFKHAYEKYDNFSSKEKDFFEIPKNWFIDEHKKIIQWQNHIKITSNKYFSHFGIINSKKKVYLAFNNTLQKAADG